MRVELIGRTVRYDFLPATSHQAIRLAASALPIPDRLQPLSTCQPNASLVLVSPCSLVTSAGFMAGLDDGSGGGSVWSPTLASLTWRVDLQQPPQSTNIDGNSNAATTQSEPLAIVRLQIRAATTSPTLDTSPPPFTSTLFSLTRSHCHSMLQQLDDIEAALSRSRDNVAAQHGQTAES